MREISEVTFNELREVFNKAVEEAYGAGKKSVEQEAQMDAIKVGDTVRYLGGDEEYEYLTAGKNYKILKKSTHPIENIPVLQIRDNRGMNKSCSLIRPDTVHLFEVIEETPVIELQVGPPWGHASSVKSPNQQRYELIQRAREFVEKHTKYNSEASAGKGVEIGYIVCIPEFIINKEKRAVTVLFKHVGDRTTVRRKGIAKCSPDDVFSADIGKAIALARALEIDIPVKLMNAVQPDEVVVGMFVKYGQGEPLKVMESLEIENSPREYTHRTTARDSPRTQIIDDTIAEYNA